MIQVSKLSDRTGQTAGRDKESEMNRRDWMKTAASLLHCWRPHLPPTDSAIRYRNVRLEN